MQESTVKGYFQNLLRRTGIVGQLIAINVVVFLVMGIIALVGSLSLNQDLFNQVYSVLAAPGDPAELLYKPWTIITQMFMHGNFFHLLFNMIALYFVGRIFVQFLGERRLLTTYIFGGLFGYMIHLIGYQTIPFFTQSSAPSVVGASGAIYAIFAATAFYRPNYTVRLFGMFTIPLIMIAVPYILIDLFSLASSDKIARLAHIGGAMFGALSIYKVHSSKQFMNYLDKLVNWNLNFKTMFKRKPKFKVYQGDAKKMTDEEFNQMKAAREERVNAILDKIAKKGYDGLSKDEKDFLFKEGQRNS